MTETVLFGCGIVACAVAFIAGRSWWNDYQSWKKMPKWWKGQVIVEAQYGYVKDGKVHVIRERV